MTRALVALLLCFGAALAQADTPGRFDYWVLSLSWSPQYCASQSRAEPSQCGESRRYGFVVHGLWPQYERGFPRACGRVSELPRSLIDRLLPIMPSVGLIRHEWREHGSCSGLDAATYFGRIEKLWNGLRIPARYRDPVDALSLSPTLLENDLIRSNPQLGPRSIALQCSGRFLREVRLCLDRDLQVRDCARDVQDRCGSTVLLRPIRPA